MTRTKETAGSVRQELDGKIEKKVPVWAFLAAIGGLGAIMAIIFIHFDNAQDKSNEKFQILDRRLTIIETKLEEHKK